jgi:FkbM family methyltransferase
MIKELARAAYDAAPLKRPIFEALRRAGLPQKVYKHLPFRGPFTVRGKDGLSFRMMAHGHVLENELFWAGYGATWEPVSLEIWRRLAPLASGVVDVGANTGVYSLVTRALNPSAHVVAFEPVARVARKLRQNVRLNGFDITIEQKAVSDRSAQVAIHDCASEHNYTASLEAGHSENDRRYMVEAIRLDDYLAGQGWPRIDLIKVDVEGHEPAAIDGMVETLARFRPSLLIEILSDDIGKRVQSHLDGLGTPFSILPSITRPLSRSCAKPISCRRSAWAII